MDCFIMMYMLCFLIFSVRMMGHGKIVLIFLLPLIVSPEFLSFASYTL